MAAAGHFEPPRFGAVAAELASIADAVEAMQPFDGRPRHPGVLPRKRPPRPWLRPWAKSRHLRRKRLAATSGLDAIPIAAICDISPFPCNPTAIRCPRSGAEA
jgi:hypothetical protein